MVNEHGCAVLAEREARLGNSHKSVGAGDGGPTLHERKRTGGLVVWLSAGLAFAGLARCVLVLQARRGRLDLTTYHGGYERMPLLAISFLCMGLACTGFPGTLGFVGQELLVQWRRRVSSYGIRSRCCLGVDGSRRTSDVLLSVLRPAGYSIAFGCSVRFGEARSIYIRGSRDRAVSLWDRATSTC
jgi:Proton-conducting membrane transporter